MKLSLQYFLFVLIFIVTSCTQNEKPVKKSWDEIYQEQKQLDSLSLVEAEKLSKITNSITGWDTSSYYTYNLQDIFDTTARPISFIGEIKDIFRFDTTYILKVLSSHPRSYINYIADISVDTKMFKELDTKLDIWGDNEGCFIFEVEKITSHFPVLESEIDPDAYNVEDVTTHIEIYFNKRLIKIQGRLVTYFIYPKVK